MGNKSILLVALLFVVLCSCRAKKEYIEVEKWQRDTISIVDTIHVKEIITVHDSIFNTEYVTQLVKDSTRKDEAYKYYTYDKEGNVTSLLDYTSSTHQGKELNTATQSESTAVAKESIISEEKSSHNESKGHSETSKETKKSEPKLSSWQKFIMCLGYLCFAALVLGVAFLGTRLYGRIRKL